MNQVPSGTGSPIDPRDRLVDHVLRELHGLHAESDLVARVSAAWERGERARDVSAVLPHAQRRAEAADARDDFDVELVTARPWKKLALAAAATLAAVAVGTWMFAVREDPARRPIATSDEPMRVYRRGSESELAARELLAGDTVLTGPVEIAFITLSDGGRLTVGPNAVVGSFASAESDAPKTWTLVRGRIELEGSKAAFELDGGLARLVATPASAIAAEVDFEDREFARSEIRGGAALAQLLARTSDAQRVFRVSVTRGGAEVSHAEGTATVAAGGVFERTGPYDATRIVTDEWRTKIVASLDKLRAGPGVPSPFWTDYKRRENEQVAAIAKYFNDAPVAWTIVLEELRARAASGELDAAFARRSVDLALLAVPRAGVPIARALWQLEPRAFEDRHFVALAARGLPEFEREALARVEEWEPGTDPIPLHSAVWAAAQGSERAKEFLRRELARTSDEPITPELLDGLALAALELELDGDTRAWPLLLDRVLPDVDQMVDANLLGEAAAYALVLRYVDEARGRRERITLARLEREIGQYVAERRSEFAEWDALLRLIKELKR